MTLALGLRRLALSRRRGALADASATILSWPEIIAWWDSAYGLTLSGAQVAAWADRKGGYIVTQSMATARPLWSPTSFGGSPGLAWDGIDDALALEGSPFPTGGDPGEIWSVTSQDVAPGDSTLRRFVSYGGAQAVARAVARGVSSGVNRARTLTGDGTALTTTEASDIDFSGRHLVRAVFGTAATAVSVDGGSAAVSSVTPATSSDRVRIGSASAGGSPTSLWRGLGRDVIFAHPLPADKATILQDFLMSRRNL